MSGLSPRTSGQTVFTAIPSSLYYQQDLDIFTHFDSDRRGRTLPVYLKNLHIRVSLNLIV